MTLCFILKFNSKYIFLFCKLWKKVIYVSLKCLTFSIWYFFHCIIGIEIRYFSKYLFFWNVVVLRSENKEVVCPEYYIFLKYILVFFFPDASPSKTCPTDKQHKNRKISQHNTQAFCGKRRLVPFFAAALSVTFAGVQLREVCAEICWVYLTRPCLSALFCTGFRTASNYLGAVGEIFRFVFAAAGSWWHIFGAFSHCSWFPPLCQWFLVRDRVYCTGVKFFPRLFMFNYRLVCVCPACFQFPWQKCFWPTIKRGRCKNTFQKMKFIFFDLQPSTRSENSRTSKARSKGAPQVTLGLMKSKARTWVFLWKKKWKYFFVQCLFS